MAEEKIPEQKVNWRQIVIETDGANVKVTKSEVNALEFRQIIALVAQQLNAPTKQ